MHTEKGSAEMQRKSQHAATLQAMARSEGVAQEVHEINKSRWSIAHAFQRRRKAAAGDGLAEAAEAAATKAAAAAAMREKTC